MIIQFEKEIDASQKEAIIDRVTGLKYKPTEVKTQKGDYLIGIGKKDFDIRNLGSMDGIKDIHIVSDDYKLVSRKWKVNPTYIDLGGGVGVDYEIKITAHLDDSRQSRRRASVRGH